MKRSYSVYEAKTHLSEILRLVRSRRPVVITDRGRAVARVVPAEPAGPIGRRLDFLAQAGIVAERETTEPRRIRPVARRPGALRRFLEERRRG